MVGLAAIANKTTGGYSLGAAGIPPGQIAFERALIFPRYVRCLGGLLLDAAIEWNTVRGNEARLVVASTGIIAVLVVFLLLT